METQNQTLELFVERLVEEKNFGNLDEEVLRQIKLDLLDRVEDRINATILEYMPPEKMEEFDALLDQGESQRIQAFCQQAIENLDEKIAAALVAFRNSYLGA